MFGKLTARVIRARNAILRFLVKLGLWASNILTGENSFMGRRSRNRMNNNGKNGKSRVSPTIYRLWARDGYR